ncbi:prolyl oligopeptidase family serine peptidase [Streptomyces coacervatus]|uniref:Prolyl oligopeptidase family serine peptidase n=1 Tax=Streptomyces coacervatus TaxID=647381 RepID=A0ABP7GQD6_9ACTN|nr:prolyl oligopeptidase family serine peptidase [Streptomyces coacervatus]MDF2264587.1 prolyl oligopeptidase family serine peptidase [Streptomyces coacervatus]
MATPSLPEQFVRTGRFTRGVPDRFTVTPDGATVLFLRARTGDDPAPCLWALDLESGTEWVLADPVRLLGHRRVGIESYTTDRSVDLIAFVLDGGLWAVRRGRGRPWRIAVHGPVSDPRPDPSGRRIAYVSRGALRVTAVDGTGDRALAEPDGPHVEFAAAEHTACTSLDGPRGHWWSPDGTRTLIARTDSASVPPWPAIAGEGPKPRYPAAGCVGPDVTLWVSDLNGPLTVVRWDRKAFEYVVGAGWDPHGPYAVVQSRDQCTVRFLAIDPDHGRTTVLDEQLDDRWVHLVPGLPARTASGGLLAHTDLRGTRHLTVDGAPVTPPGLQLRAVLGTDGDQVLFTASDEPTETHLWRYRPADGARRLTVDPGVHFGVCRGGTLVRVGRGADGPGGRAEVVRDGKPAAAVTSFAERPVLGLHMTRLVLGPRGLRARLHFPSWHRPGSGPLPVLADPYGGAGGQRVTAEVDWKVLVSQWFAEQGFAVPAADGRGTPGRGPDWEREIHGDLFGPALDDQVTALHEAARLHPDLDLGRVGIRGWSFGAGLATAAVLRRPDVFHVAVAGAGVTDQRLYDAHWRERFLGHPDRYPHRYEACSLIREAPNLARPLLLIHGLADLKVPPANTVRLSDALHAACRPHEVLLLPGIGHQPMGTAISEELMDRQMGFLWRHLGPRRAIAAASGVGDG